MNLSCIHCGKQFSVSVEQLGGRGRCPHCRGEIQLPRADEDHPAEQQPHLVPFNWLENSISMLGSIVFHMMLVIVLALIRWGTPGLPGSGEDVLIGVLPSQTLSDMQEEDLQLEEKADKKESEDTFDDLLDEIAPPSSASDEAAIESFEVTISPSGGSSSFDLGAVNLSGGSMAGGGDWDGMIQRLRRDGLDIVIAFDSTGSMSGEINQVKGQIGRIGETLLRLVPKSRISICTYRDEDDEFVVKGLPLTNDLQQIQGYLDDIYASGGGDMPEAVHEGLRWSMTQNQFRGRARKVVLLFGDAPPHQTEKKLCLQLAADFSSQQKGVVSTVTCRQSTRIPEFVEIAQMGGGEAFLTSDERQIMTQLMVLVFGSQYRSKVLEAFKMLEG